MIIAFALPFTYGGCSDGGGGSSDGSGGTSYSGLTNPAEINESNAEDIGDIFPGQPVDHVAGDGAGKIPSGMGHDTADSRGR